MLKEKMIPFSILCLSISIIIGSTIIDNGMKGNANNANVRHQ